LAKGKRDRRRRAERRSQSAGGSRQPTGNSLELGAHAAKLSAPSSDYSDEQGNVLTLRGSLTPGARREYAQMLTGAGATAAATQEDIAQRAFELLFERLAVRWQIADAPIERQRELLARFRAATQQERAFVRSAMREHCAEHFPELQAP
jgi:hypothetical protein